MHHSFSAMYGVATLENPLKIGQLLVFGETDPHQNIGMVLLNYCVRSRRICYFK